ncbi:MAG: alpha/beta hydrolase [Myxococcales bacterium]|nr:alpha/beta hydrolase [Myxococcales bacterium]
MKTGPMAALLAALLAAVAPVDGLQLYYEIHGEGEPLVLIHGGGSTIESNWSRMIPLLARSRRVIAIEEQGHGHTPAIDRPFTFDNTADDVAALLDYLHVGRADLFGFSNGGQIALRVAKRHPKQVRKLVIASAPFQREGMAPGFWEGLEHATLEQMPAALKEADREINPDPKHLRALFEHDRGRMLAFRGWPEADLRSIAAPALVVVGDQDVVTVEHALRMRNALPHARLAVLPGNHGSYLGEAASSGPPSRIPEATAMLVEEFLSAAQ